MCNKMYCRLGCILLAVVILPLMVFAQGPVAVIKVEAFSPQELHDLG